MRKDPVAVNVPELTEILENYLDADSTINYAVKIVGHPGIGKSDVVRQTARSRNLSSLSRSARWTFAAAETAMMNAITRIGLMMARELSPIPRSGAEK